MEEYADLAQHAQVMTSCLAVVEKLRTTGRITFRDEQRARSFLVLQERPWPNQPTINDDAILYLDNLAVGYLAHLGLLDKLQPAGLQAVISPRVVSEINDLIAYESISDKVTETIERIRVAVNTHIESGKIKVGTSEGVNENERKLSFSHPTIELAALVPRCNAIVCDDRSLNRNMIFTEGDKAVPLLTTVDILNSLAAVGGKSRFDQSRYHTALRRAGYIFVPLSEAEVTEQLVATTVEDGRLRESAELKAIRESILGVRMSDWLQLPSEAQWLDTALNALMGGIKTLWKERDDLSAVTELSDWVAAQVDLQGWAHSFGEEDGRTMITTGRSAHIADILRPLFDMTSTTRDAYWAWATRRLLGPIQEQFPELYSAVVDFYKRWVDQMTEIELADREGG